MYLHVSPSLNIQQCQIKYHLSGDLFFMHLVQRIITWFACVVKDILTLHLNYAQICVGHLHFCSCL